MQKSSRFYQKINIRILIMMFILFIATAFSVSLLNQYNLRLIYEKNFTEKVLLSNDLIATLINGRDVKYYVDLLAGKDEAFKRRQTAYYNDREELFRLQESGAPEEEQEIVINRMETFHREMSALKSGVYWSVVENLRVLRDLSHSKYVYVFADTGVTNDDGTKLYTYIFDANDDDIYDSPDSDGLGTANIGEDIVAEIYATKKSMETVMYYSGIYGELYFAYAPVLDDDGNVIAILGTDLDPGEMRREIMKSILLFSTIFFSFGIVIILIIYLYVSRIITKPLGELTLTAQKIAGGDVYTFVPNNALKQNSELGILARAVNDMSGVYQNMIKSTEDILAAAHVGKLLARNDISKYRGDIKKALQQTNETLDVMVLYLNSVPDAVLIMNKDFGMYFQNDQYKKFFGNMSILEFLGNIFPQIPRDRHDLLKSKFIDLLSQENNTITVWIHERCFSVILKEINLNKKAENSVMVIAMDITALKKEQENAQAAAKAKSDFLSRMSHEMRTPMNAIIGMTKMANSTNEISKLKYCLSTIGTSSKLLLGIINDVLDMSKIEAGKFELEISPMNIEKMLVEVCNIVNENIKNKNQKFNVILDNNLSLNYRGDELKLSQVIINLLSNAIKFTPENGEITLGVEETGRHESDDTLRFSVSDTGIGMTQEQVGRLFSSFEQADGSITRRFGGTGLGLAISKKIVEKMNGRIWVESEYGSGSRFNFEVNMERMSHRDTTRISEIHQAKIKVLLVADDRELRERFLLITEGFGINVAAAGSAEEAFWAIETPLKSAAAHTIVFLDCNLPGNNCFETAKKISEEVGADSIVLITSLLERTALEKNAGELNISRFITKPIFPSAILDTINDCLGAKIKTQDKETKEIQRAPDLSGIHILLAEDVEINREIFMELLADTQISIDSAENGLAAVEKFRENSDKYDLIIMDIQMPEMDGFEATRTIRALDTAGAKSVPIIAMTANVLKEDIDRCIECGMNDHLAKPIDEEAVIEKIMLYSKRGQKS